MTTRKLLAWLSVAVAVAIASVPSSVPAQTNDEATSAEETVEAPPPADPAPPAEPALTRRDVERIVDDVVQDRIQDEFARGSITLEGAEIRFGGKLELNFVDTQAERDPVKGRTEDPDPHFDFDRFRFEPEIDIGRQIEIHGQMDFFSEEGDAFVKEATFVHDWNEVWWFESRSQIGLDDRFIHLGPSARVTESYPLAGTAFWRDEEVAFVWAGRLGHKRGRPVEEASVARRDAAEWPPRDTLTNSTAYSPFDLANNPGALTAFFSIGNGVGLGSKAVTKDNGDLQQIVQDDRDELSNNLSLRNIGVGLQYERDFNYLGEVGVLGFYFEDQLSDDSVEFLQDELTLRDPLTGDPVSGYGDSTREGRARYGVRLDYHLEGFHLLDRWVDTRPGDGLYLRGEYIRSHDGELDRYGWYVQGSYRYSFTAPLLFDYWIRSVEPVVRYGELESDVDNVPSLPLTWDRRELVVGAVVELAPRVIVKGEYLFNFESAGDGDDVDNNELLLQLLLLF